MKSTLMTTLRYTEDSLGDIKNIISYYFDTIDYTSYIQELDKIINNLNGLKDKCTTSEELRILNILHNKANTYLAKAKSLQRLYEAQGVNEG